MNGFFMIKIIDYGMGNCGSIKNMLRYLGAQFEVIDNPDKLFGAKAIILPGVGSFDNGMAHLEPFRSILELLVFEDKVPFLGVCLGMQLLFESSDEGDLPGLSWIKGQIRRFDFSGLDADERLVVPHMGWNEVRVAKENPLLQLKVVKDRFYFVHSYRVTNVNDENVLAVCHYGCDFTCAVQKENIFGVQFHPEKSHKFGKQLFQGFIELSKC